MITYEQRTLLRKYFEACACQDHPESQLMALLHRAQDICGYLDKEVLSDLSECLNIPKSTIWGVATFYSHYTTRPVGKHAIAVCMGTACFVKGAHEVLETLKALLGVDIGETTSDMLFTLTEARCVGTCGLAPVVMVDDRVYGRVTAEELPEILARYR